MRFAKDTFLQFDFVSGPLFSQDGKYVAYGVVHPDVVKNGYDRYVKIYDLKKGKTMRTSCLNNGGYRWMKDELLLQESRGEEKGAFWKLNMHGGEAQKAFEMDKIVTSCEIMDEDHLLVSVLEGTDKQENPEQYHELDTWPFWFNGPGFISGTYSHLYVYEISTKSWQKINDEKMNVSGFVYTGKYAVYAGEEICVVPTMRKGIYAGKECLVEPGVFHVTAVIPKDETHVLFVAADDMDSSGNVYELDIETKQKRMIGALDNGIGSTIGCDAHMGHGQVFKVVEDELWYVTTVAEKSVLMAMDMDGHKHVIREVSGAIMSFDVYEGHLAYEAMVDLNLSEIYVDDEKITDNSSVLEDYELSTPEYVEYINRDDVSIHGYVMKPVGFTEGKKYPAILHIHGGPRTSFGSVLHSEMQLWAAQGYVVLYCNPRGSDGRGDEFADIYGKYGTIEYEDLMGFVMMCLGRFSFIDKDRLGVGGGSYGGFMTNWIIGHTDLFKAAVSQRSIANWITFENTSDIGLIFSRSQHKAMVEEDVEKLWWHSPVKYADNAKTPTLFIHSDQDYRCYMVEGLAMLTALKMHGVPSRMALVHGESHELSRSGKPRNRIKRMEEIVNWYDTYLKGGQD